MKGWLWLPVTLDAGVGRLVARPERRRGQFLASLGDKLGDAQEGRGRELREPRAGVGGGVREGGRRAEPGARQGCPPGVGWGAGRATGSQPGGDTEPRTSPSWGKLRKRPPPQPP